MEDLRKLKMDEQLEKTSPCMLAMNRSRHVVSKPAAAAAKYRGSSKCRLHQTNNSPAIRVVHIFAPQVIKTDPENFRSLVQRLTGKSNQALASEDTQKPNEKMQTNTRSLHRSSPEAISIEANTENSEDHECSNRELLLPNNIKPCVN